jgi:hypothetical protein
VGQVLELEQHAHAGEDLEVGGVRLRPSTRSSLSGRSRIVRRTVASSACDTRASWRITGMNASCIGRPEGRCITWRASQIRVSSLVTTR